MPLCCFRVLHAKQHVALTWVIESPNRKAFGQRSEAEQSESPAISNIVAVLRCFATRLMDDGREKVAVVLAYVVTTRNTDEYLYNICDGGMGKS